jgi:hypothetical protein
VSAERVFFTALVLFTIVYLVLGLMKMVFYAEPMQLGGEPHPTRGCVHRIQRRAARFSHPGWIAQPDSAPARYSHRRQVPSGGWGAPAYSMWFAADGHATFTALSEAKSSSDMMGHPLALQLRDLQTLVELGVEKNATVVFPAPLMSAIGELGSFPARETTAAAALARQAVSPTRVDADCQRLRRGRPHVELTHSPTRRVRRADAIEGTVMTNVLQSRRSAI